MQSLKDTELREAPRRRVGYRVVRVCRRRICTRLSYPTPWTNSAFAIRRCVSISDRCTTSAPFAGWARTISCTDIHYIPDDPYGMEIEAIDSLFPGEVAVVGTHKSMRNAPWGELLSTAARARGARGAIIDGLIRDVLKIEELGFPVFASWHQAGRLNGARRGDRIQRAGRVR